MVDVILNMSVQAWEWITKLDVEMGVWNFE